MNRTALQRLLDAEGFNSLVYSLQGGVGDDLYSMSPDGEGWLVYFSESGAVSHRSWFATEEEACEELLLNEKEFSGISSMDAVRGRRQ